MQLDAADESALKAIGAAEFEHAIVAISDGVEASVFAVMALKQLGVGNVIAKAGSELHGAILERVGADRVVFAEREMGQRVAHSFALSDVVEYLDVAPRFGIVKVRPPARLGRPPARRRGRVADAGGAPSRRRRHGEPVPRRGDPGGRRGDPDREGRPDRAAAAGSNAEPSNRHHHPGQLPDLWQTGTQGQVSVKYLF